MLSSRRFAVAFAAGLVLRILTLPLPGHEDVGTWKIWSYAASRGVTTMYGVGGSPPTRGVVRYHEFETTVDYPPFFLYEYAIVGRIYGTVFPAYPNTLALHVAVKLPVLLANLLLTVLFYFAVHRVSKEDRLARWAALAYWLNPATIFGGEMLGYVDPLFLLPAIGALVLAWFGRPWWAGAVAAIAVATKPQAILLGPALALALWQAAGIGGVSAAGAAFAATIAAIVLPFALNGSIPNMLLAFGSFTERRDTMSAYACNLGWIVNWALRSWFGVPELGVRAFFQQVPRPLAISRFRELGYPDPRPASRAAVLATVAWAAWQGRRARDLAVVAAVGAFTVHAFFVLSPGMHEGHQLFEIPLLVLAAALRPRFRPLFFLVSGIVTLNINYLYGFGLGVGWAVPRMLTGLDISVALAFVNVAVLFWFAARLRAEVGTASASPAAV